VTDRFMGRFWLVEIADDLEHSRFPTTRGGVWAGVMNVNGVIGCTDLRSITLETLCTLLMSDEEFADMMREVLKPKGSSWTGTQAIRGYWKLQRQPKLPGLN